MINLYCTPHHGLKVRIRLRRCAKAHRESCVSPVVVGIVMCLLLIWETIDEFASEDGEEYEGSRFGGFADYMRRKKLKLQNLDAEIRSSNTNNPPLFRGVVAHVNGYTQPSLNDLHRLIVSHGGGFLQYMDGKTSATHIIASSLTPKKREEFRRYRIVKPAWVVESVKAGRLLPWDHFRVVDEAPSQKVISFGGDGRITSQSSSQRLDYKEQSDGSWYTSQLQPTPEVSGQVEPRDTGWASPGESKNAIHMQDHVEHITPAKTSFDAIDHLISDGPEASISDFSEAEKQEPSEAKQPTSDQGEPPQAPNNHDGEHTMDSMSPEEYNAKLLSNPVMRSSSVVNPDFIQQFYRESRLHHLSTWKADLKAQLQRAAQEKQSHIVRKPRAPGARRYIMHVDFDCFFAAVSIQKQPQLAHKPVAVAHGSGSGSEIASCNYSARAFGVKNGMWMRGAIQMCPDLQVVPYDFEAYEDASRKFYDAILSLDAVVQSVSIDEALIDITSQCLQAGGSNGKGISEGSIYREQMKADEIAQTLRDSIKEKTGCSVSVGIGGNILQAKVALKEAKPAGQFQLKPERVLDFIGNLTVQTLPSVAHSLGGKLEEIGVTFVKDIRELSKEKLVSHLGPKTGAKLWDYARGIDRVEVGEEIVRKSVSAEINWGIRFVTQEEAEKFVQSLCDELHRRLVENLVKGKQLTMRIMRRSADAPLKPVKHLGHGKCDTFNKSVALGVSTNASDIIGKEAISILRSFKVSPGDLRGLGVQMTKLEPIKGSVNEDFQSSQQQLRFRALSEVKKPRSHPDPDEIDSPRKGDTSSQNLPDSLLTGLPLNDESQKPLNITGTQFVLPSQPDPDVVAELPKDVRSKFVPNPRNRITELFRAATPTPSSRPASPTVHPQLPSQSQLDMKTLEELPEDVRSEVLAYYGQAPSPPTQNPPVSETSRSRPTTSSKVRKPTTPTKPRPGRGRGRPPSRPSSNSNLIQSNFNFYRSGQNESAPVTEQLCFSNQISTDSNDDISPDVLAALPEDIQREVLEEHKRARLQKRSGLNIPPTRRSLFVKQTPSKPFEQKRLVISSRPEKPTFTSKRLSALPDLRTASSEWYQSFRTEGPYEEDTAALVKYLKRVVLEEKDTAKAVSVANWLAWLVQDGAQEEVVSPNDSPSSAQVRRDVNRTARESWSAAVQQIKDGVNHAVKERGLPPIDFY